MWFPYWEEATKRMNKRRSQSVCWHLPDGRMVEYQKITATQARNTDGSFAGWDSDDRNAIQQKITTVNGVARYSNRWLSMQTRASTC